MKRSRSTYVILMAALLLGLIVTPAQAGDTVPPPRVPFAVQVVSSLPDQVSGGDARLHISVPLVVPLQQVTVLVNGQDESARFAPIPGTRTLTGVVNGLAVGANTVKVMANGQGGGRPDPVTLTLTDYPIEGPIFSGPHQYPFVCTVQEYGLGEPLKDNDSTGIPVHENGNPAGPIIGYSKDCAMTTLVQYVYRSTAGNFKPYSPGQPRPADMAQATTNGRRVDYIVRWERGTINRFIYSVAMLAPDDTTPQDLSRTAWNGKVIYSFDGGVGIGHSQGSPSQSGMLYDTGLSQGYAVLWSTGTRTATHYNLIVGGETALMVKERFIELYDTPIYTVGVGGSGGGIQQYIYGQNYGTRVIDAAIPQYSYPDMVTQAVHVGDCELLEFYMDVLDGANPMWQTWSNRRILEGLNASNTVPNPYRGGAPGNTECINGWRGLAPLALNPHYGSARAQQKYVPQSDIAAIEWTHFADIVNVVGRGADGYARRYWDNVGVQYGLEALTRGQITFDEFLKLNASIGGWKDESQMVQEGPPFVNNGTPWDPWSSRNQIYSANPAAPAPRTLGDIQAMLAVYQSGLVFMGKIDIPIIDWRHYLEAQLNMHNSQQSFASRQRMRDGKGNSDNQVIWFTDAPNGPQFDQTPEALAVMDQWMANIKAHPEKTVAENKPPLAVDRCFNADGSLIAQGDHVWDGILDSRPAGACTQRFPIYETPRRIAGGKIRGSIFKCQLQPVDAAIAKGLYGNQTATAQARRVELETIFPTGVCDFDRPDVGLPPGW